MECFIQLILGLRDIIRIPCDMENTGSTDRLTVEESLKEREIAYHVSAPGTLVSSTNYSVILWEGEDYEQFWDVPLSGKLQVWNCLAVGCLCSDCRCCFVFCGDFVKDTW